MGLVTIFYCIIFETSLFVASYDRATVEVSVERSYVPSLYNFVRNE
jgi:hypothetical protein